MEFDAARNLVHFSEEEMQEFTIPAQLAPGTMEFEVCEDRIRASSIEAVIAARLAVEEDTISVENYTVLQERARRSVALCLELRNIRRQHEITSLEQDFER